MQMVYVKKKVEHTQDQASLFWGEMMELARNELFFKSTNKGCHMRFA